MLVLNRGWVPITTRSMAKAYSLVMRGHARVVEPTTYEIFDWAQWINKRSIPVEEAEDLDKEHWVYTPKLAIRTIDVVTLANYAGSPRVGVPYSRKAIYARDDNICQLCGKKVLAKFRTIDHVIPKSRGGDTSWINCVLACQKCNHKKGDKLLHECGMSLLREPFKPSRDQAVLLGGHMKPIWENFLPGHKK